MTPESARPFVEKFGRASNSFMTLYEGFRYFAFEQEGETRGVIAYSDTGGAWVGGAEPFAPEELHEQALSAFAAAAARVGRTAYLIPVGEKVARRAIAAGYRSLMVGTEPAFRLDQYPPTGSTWLDVVPTARILHGKGARVSELDAAAIEPARREELRAIEHEWLRSRGMDPLGFLNQVEPWKHAERKRYFAVELGGRTLAFLAAIPIRASNGWYLIDLFRRGDSPAGTTELLLLQAMKLLREAGAEWISMGISPLSGLERAASTELADFTSHGLLYRILSAAYERGNLMYSFKPLFQYKLKFRPTGVEPAYLVYRRARGEPSLRIRDALALFRAFLPKGMIGATRSGLVRLALRFRLSEWIRARLRSDVVVRSTPPGLGRLLARLSLTMTLVQFNIGLFIWANGMGPLDPALSARWSFSWPKLLVHPYHALALSPFLHEGPRHLAMNLAGFVLFTAGLEYVAGSGLTAACYLIPMWLANPITGGLLALLGHAGEADVGASLGIFGTAGALLMFVRARAFLAIGLLAAIAGDFALRGVWITWNHAVAMALGLAVARLALRN